MGIVGTAARIEQMAASESTDNERDALRRVFSTTADALYRFILARVGGNRDVAGDLLQQTCIEAVRHRRPPAEGDEIEAWLRGIARNLIRRQWRLLKKESRRVSLENADLASQLADDMESRPLPPDALMRKESIRQLLLAVTSLPAADQSLVFDFYFDGRQQAEIARDMDVSEKSIESRLYRVRGRLRAALRNMRRSGER